MARMMNEHPITKPVHVASAVIGGDGPLALIAGTCVIESREMALEIGRAIAKIGQEFGIPVIFKASFDKANRMSLASFRGPGLEEGLAVLKAVKQETGLPVDTDIHEAGQAARVAEVADLLQIPALLCRQTDLVVAAARTGKPLLIKKGQFMAPEDMAPIVAKATESGASGVLLAERGTSFGYHRLVVDMRSLAAMRALGWPIVFDATHSVQLPGGAGQSSGGEREYVAPLARAAAAVGIDVLFVETHPDPARARSDPETQVPLRDLPELVKEVLAMAAARRAVMEGSPG
jgi:2-dehydro-3-deoxyphosphooctonate aldolase (KDO 8-P synthase)